MSKQSMQDKAIKKYTNIYILVVAIFSLLLSSCNNTNNKTSVNSIKGSIQLVDKSKVNFDTEALSLYKPILEEGSYGAEIFKVDDNIENQYIVSVLEYSDGKLGETSNGEEFTLDPSDYLLVEVFDGKVNCLLFKEGTVKNVMDYEINNKSMFKNKLAVWNWLEDSNNTTDNKSILFTSYTSNSEELVTPDISQQGLDALEKYKDVSGVVVQLEQVDNK